ncbi:MAG: hypothetical protein K0R27_4689 [Xanthobacteraceae bacterium]|jgi:hypothetical protein|nr:hypothetical protein [Xanthobacteraceae bacterium]
MRYAALVAIVAFAAAPALAQEAQERITIHPGGGSDTEITFPTHNNPNYLDYGPLDDKPGSDKSEDYQNQAGGNDPIDSGPGSDVDADLMPDNDGAYDEN